MSELEKQLGGILGGDKGGGGLGGILDRLRGGGGSGALTALLPVVAGLLANGGLQKILSRLQAQGAGEETKSWVSTGENKPVSAQQMKNAVDNEELAQVAEKLGVSDDQAAEVLAKVVPHVVDKASPDGAEPSQESVDLTVQKLAQEAGAARA